MAKDPEELLREAARVRGFVEDFHIFLAERDPEFLDRWNGIWDHVLQKSILDDKTKALIRVGVSSALRIEKGTENAIDAAIRAGATIEEIANAVEIAFIYGGAPSLMLGLNILKKKVDKITKK